MKDSSRRKDPDSIFAGEKRKREMFAKWIGAGKEAFNCEEKKRNEFRQAMTALSTCVREGSGPMEVCGEGEAEKKPQKTQRRESGWAFKVVFGLVFGGRAS